MLFNSYIFLFVFLPVTIIGYFIINRLHRLMFGKLWLVACSMFFYAYWNSKYLVIILFSIGFNYILGFIFSHYKKFSGRFWIMVFGVAVNIGMLGWFKYADFMIANINFAVGSNINLLKIVLPLAISFFTFQQVAFVVDSYKGRSREYNFVNYCLFVTFFPQLIAGPIVHHSEMLPQFAENKNKFFNSVNFSRGLFLLGMGLFKKVVIADSLSSYADMGFDLNSELNMLEAWVASLSYTFQLYFDFSAYTDMALGAACFVNIKLPMNFNSPYKSLNIQEFWHRWHITLGRWLKNYIYIPLGGNQCAETRTCFNLFLTFVIGGIWHGASWTFVAWGGMHGVAMLVYHLWKKTGAKLPVILAWIITFGFVNCSWVFFRATTFEHALRVLRGMFGFNGIVITDRVQRVLGFLAGDLVQFKSDWLVNIGGSKNILALIIMCMILCVFFKNLHEVGDGQMKKAYMAIPLSVAAAVAILWLNKESAFLYFQF